MDLKTFDALVIGGINRPPPRRAPTGLGWAHEIKADGYRALGRKVERRGWDLVTWYNAERGFGFVSLGGAGKDVFVHASVVVNSSVASQSKYGVDDAMS